MSPLIYLLTYLLIAVLNHPLSLTVLANKIVVVVGYFTKQSDLYVFNNSRCAWWVIGWPKSYLDTTTQEIVKSKCSHYDCVCSLFRQVTGVWVTTYRAVSHVTAMWEVPSTTAVTSRRDSVPVDRTSSVAGVTRSREDTSSCHSTGKDTRPRRLAASGYMSLFTRQTVTIWIWYDDFYSINVAEEAVIM